MKTSAQKRSCLFVLIVTMLFAMLFSMDAMAKPKNAPDNGAKALIREAAAAYEKGDFDVALAKFNEAYAIEPQSSILYNMGRVCESKADYQGAIVYYKQFLTAPGSDEDARVDAIDRIKNINETLSILGTPAGGVQAPVVAVAPVAGVAVAPVAVVAPAGGCVDINTASAAELESKIKGVGSVMANNIVEARPFKSVDDLQRVPRIGAKTLEKLRPQICPIGAGVGAAPAAKSAPVVKAPAAPAAAPAKAKSAKKADAGAVFDI